jgi:pimeloyl-ACP methyl ester carboxylesterase
MFSAQFSACSEFRPFFDYMDYTPHLRHITTRTSLLGGEFDHVTPAFAMREIAAQLPNYFMYLDPHVGHGIFEKPECTKRLLNAFFQDLSNLELKRITLDSVCTAAPVAKPAADVVVPVK